MQRRHLNAALAAALLLKFEKPSSSQSLASSSMTSTFVNPVLKSQQAGDPWVIWHDGFYYFTATFLEQRSLQVWRSRTLTNLDTTEKVTVWQAPADGPRSAMIWAPELHLLRGKWVLYYTASDQLDANHRHYVLEADQPMGPYTDRGRVHAEHERYAIDGSVLSLPDGRLFWMYADAGLWIAPMSSPTRASGAGVRFATGSEFWEHGWELRQGEWHRQETQYWIEAPQMLLHEGRIFVVYSAGHTACHYYLGLLELVGSDPMNPASWVKHPGPVFAPYAGPDGSVVAPGHCSLTQSPDGRESWLVYHAMDVDKAGQPLAARWGRAQRFAWSASGLPQFGHPVPRGVALAKPAGE